MLNRLALAVLIGVGMLGQWDPPVQADERPTADLIQAAMEAATQLNWGQAEQLYLQALQREPQNAPLYNNLAVVRRRQGNLAGAISAYRQAVALDPKLTEAYVNLGIALLLTQDWQSALGVLQQARALGRVASDLDFYLGLAHEKLEQWPEAAFAYRTFVQQRPLSFAYFRLAIVQWQSGNGTEALTAFRYAAQLDPQVSLYTSEAGLALAKAGDSEESIQFLSALPGTWANPTDLVVLARLAHQGQQLDLARTAIQRAIQLSQGPTPPSPGTLTGIPLSVINDAAVIEANQDRRQAALDYLLSAQQQLPGNLSESTPGSPLPERRDAALVLSNLAALYLEQQDLPLALETGQRALEWDPGLAAAANTTAVALLGLGRATEALPLLQQAAQDKQGDWGILRNLGIAYALLGNRAAATEALQAAMTKAPTIKIQQSLNQEVVKLQQMQLPSPPAQVAPAQTPDPVPTPTPTDTVTPG